jgi:hypothetical protein
MKHKKWYFFVASMLVFLSVAGSLVVIIFLVLTRQAEYIGKIVPFPISTVGAYLAQQFGNYWVKKRNGDNSISVDPIQEGDF